MHVSSGRRRKTLLKTSKQRVESKRGNAKPRAKSSRARTDARVGSASRSLQAEGRRSTAASLLRSAPGGVAKILTRSFVSSLSRDRKRAFDAGGSSADDAGWNTDKTVLHLRYICVICGCSSRPSHRLGEPRQRRRQLLDLRAGNPIFQ